jgi:hypothetical protein
VGAGRGREGREGGGRGVRGVKEGEGALGVVRLNLSLSLSLLLSFAMGGDQEGEVDDDEPKAHEEDVAEVGAGERAAVGGGAELHPGDGDEAGVGGVGQERAVAGAGAADREVAGGELLQRLADEEREEDAVDELEGDVANRQDDLVEGEGEGEHHWGRERAHGVCYDGEQERQSEISACLREDSVGIRELSRRAGTTCFDTTTAELIAQGEQKKMINPIPNSGGSNSTRLVRYDPMNGEIKRIDKRLYTIAL